MKKKTASLLSLSIVFSLVACGSSMSVQEGLKLAQGIAGYQSTDFFVAPNSLTISSYKESVNSTTSTKVSRTRINTVVNVEKNYWYQKKYTYRWVSADSVSEGSEERWVYYKTNEELLYDVNAVTNNEGTKKTYTKKAIEEITSDETIPLLYATLTKYYTGSEAIASLLGYDTNLVDGEGNPYTVHTDGFFEDSFYNSVKSNSRYKIISSGSNSLETDLSIKSGSTIYDLDTTFESYRLYYYHYYCCVNDQYTKTTYDVSYSAERTFPDLESYQNVTE